MAYYKGIIVLSNTENKPKSFLLNLFTPLINVKNCLVILGIFIDFKPQYNCLNNFLIDFKPQYNLFKILNFINLNTEL